MAERSQWCAVVCCAVLCCAVQGDRNEAAQLASAIGELTVNSSKLWE